MDEQNPVDPLPGLLAELDQYIKIAPMMAQMVRTQYDALRAEGFNDKQALYLASTGINRPDVPSE